VPYTWQFRPEPSPNVTGALSSSRSAAQSADRARINGMIINRGQPTTTTAGRSAAMRAGASRPAAVFQAVRAADRWRRRSLSRPRRQYPGDRSRLAHEICEAFLAGTTGSANSAHDDYNGASQPGAGYLQRNIHKGLRRSAGRMYLCRRRRSPAGSIFEPDAAPFRSCSKAGRPWAFAMSTRRAAPSTR